MENQSANAQALESAVRSILQKFDDPTREGLKETPARYVRFLDEFLNPPEFNFTTFDAENYDEMIVEANIPFYSLCEHHIAPFFGTAAIGYIPNTTEGKQKIVGLSKLPRVLEMFARRFQTQERITKQTAEYLNENLEPQGVAVVLKAQHLCMAMRGVKKHDVYTTTSAMIGSFREHASTRSEFMSIIRAAG